MSETVGFLLAVVCLIASGFCVWLGWWIWHYTPTQADFDHWRKRDRQAALVRALKKEKDNG